MRMPETKCLRREPSWETRSPAVTWLPKMSNIFYKKELIFSKHNVNVPCLVKTLKVSFTVNLFLNKVLAPQAPRRGIPVSHASTSSTSLLTGLSSLDPLLVNTVTERTWS